MLIRVMHFLAIPLELTELGVKRPLLQGHETHREARPEFLYSNSSEAVKYIPVGANEYVIPLVVKRRYGSTSEVPFGWE